MALGFHDLYTCYGLIKCFTASNINSFLFKYLFCWGVVKHSSCLFRKLLFYIYTLA